METKVSEAKTGKKRGPKSAEEKAAAKVAVVHVPDDVKNPIVLKDDASKSTQPRLYDKPGRPIDPESERQKKIQFHKELEMKGLKIKRGRPIDPESERQKRIKAYAEKREKGILKRGRPAKISEKSK